MADDSIRLFGFEIKRAKDKSDDKLRSIVTPVDEYGAGYVRGFRKRYRVCRRYRCLEHKLCHDHGKHVTGGGSVQQRHRCLGHVLGGEHVLHDG